MSVPRSRRTRTVVATLALLGQLGGCAADGERVTEPRTVRASSLDAPASLRYVESQRMVRVISPEGMIPTVRDFDIAYELQDRDGRSTPLPFLDVRNADATDVFNRVTYFPTDQAWLAMSVRSTHHYEHVKGVNFEEAEDDFTTMRVAAFTRDRLVARRELRVCNPGRSMNPVIRFDPASRVLHYCTRGGQALYDAMTGKERVLDATACCPSAAGTTDKGTRYEERLVVDDAP